METTYAKRKIESLVSLFPETDAVFGYGSGAFYQPGYDDKTKKQLDVIIAVDNIVEWNKRNIIDNPTLYPLLSKVFYSRATEERQKNGARICYTSYINAAGETFKIGVIETKDLISDLLNWDTFYLAGRFQKEMLTVKGDKRIEQANKINRYNALTLAFLMLDTKMANTKEEVYRSICSLSYLGDSRKKLGAEDPEKEKKLLKGSFEFFNSTYLPDERWSINQDGTVSVNCVELEKAVSKLPVSFKSAINDAKRENGLSDLTSPLIRETIANHLKKLNSISSKKQTRKGIYTTGVGRSIRYAGAKLMKGLTPKFKNLKVRFSNFVKHSDKINADDNGKSKVKAKRTIVKN